jgi:hypothetical protein
MTSDTEGRRKKLKILIRNLYREQINKINDEYLITFNMKKRSLSLKFIFCEYKIKHENERKKPKNIMLVISC